MMNFATFIGLYEFRVKSYILLNGLTVPFIAQVFQYFFNRNAESRMGPARHDFSHRNEHELSQVHARMRHRHIHFADVGVVKAYEVKVNAAVGIVSVGVTVTAVGVYGAFYIQKAVNYRGGIESG